jgi:hypothetical protein
MDREKWSKVEFHAPLRPSMTAKWRGVLPGKTENINHLHQNNSAADTIEL